MVDPIGTCQALDLLTQDQLEQLFDESNGYLSKVDEIFDTVQILDMQHHDSEEHTHHSSTTDSNPNNDDDHGSEDDAGGTGTADDTASHPHNHIVTKPRVRRQSSIVTNKKCLILDVDNTLIYVRHFMDEMRVGDRVKLGDQDAIVTKITYRLDLELSENPGQMSGYDHVLQNKEDSIPQRGEWFPDEVSKVAIIHQSDPTGCVIHLVTEEEEEEDEEDEDEDDDKEDIEISFLQNSDHLSQLEPMMNRSNYLSVTFMYGGYLVRIRPGLAQFLSLCNAKYDVILFTAADGSVYQGLLKQVHHILKQELEQNDDIDFEVPNKLWDKVYFRNDCDEKLDEYGLPYRHKNLAKLGRDLSTIVMVDDNPLSYRGFEPNSVRVAGFWGLSHPSDKELMNTLFPTLWTIANHKDVRYYLSGLGQPPDNEHHADASNDAANPFANVSAADEDDDLLSKQRRHSRQASAKFLQHLKEAIVAENESLEASSEDEEDETEREEDAHHVNGGSHHDRLGEEDDDDDLMPEATPEPGSTTEDDTHSLDSISNKEKKEDENPFKIPHNETEDGGNTNIKNRTYENKELDEIFNSDITNHVEDNFLDMFQKRPSVELDDGSDIIKKESDARKTNPNSPKGDDHEEEDGKQQEEDVILEDEEEEEELEDEEEDNDAHYVIALQKDQSGSVSISSTKRADAQLLGDRDRDRDMDHDEMVGTAGSRPSRTPTPLTDIEAEILIEKAQQAACGSCFGFFGKKNKNKNKNIGLAQQELR